MIQLVICISRNDSVTPEDFRRHWHEVQGPAVRGLMETLGAQGATQALTLEVERNKLIRDRYRTQAPFDGIVTLLFDHPDQLVKKVGHPDLVMRLMRIYQDHLPFLDLPRCSVFYTEAPVSLNTFNPDERDGSVGDYDVEDQDADGG